MPTRDRRPDAKQRTKTIPITTKTDQPFVGDSIEWRVRPDADWNTRSEWLFACIIRGGTCIAYSKNTNATTRFKAGNWRIKNPGGLY